MSINKYCQTVPIFIQDNQEREERIRAKEAQARELMQLILATNRNAANHPTIRNILKNI